MIFDNMNEFKKDESVENNEVNSERMYLQRIILQQVWIRHERLLHCMPVVS